MLQLRFIRGSYIDYLVYLSNPPNDLDIIVMANKLFVTLQDDTKWEIFGMSLLGTTSKEKMNSIRLECQGESPMTKYKRLLEDWKEQTSESECRWEKVKDVLNKMNFKRLAEAMNIGGSRADQPTGTGTIHLDKEVVSEGASSNQPNEHGCISEYSLPIDGLHVCG